MRSYTRWAALAALPLLFAALAACGSPSGGGPSGAENAADCPVQPPNGQPYSVKLAYNPTLLSALPISIALEKGYFTQEGVTPEVTELPGSANEMFPQLARGGLDLLAGGLGAPLFNARHQGFDVKIIMAYGANKEGYLSTVSIVATPEAAARLQADPSALKDLRLEQLAEGSSASLLMQNLIQQSGLGGQVQAKSSVAAPPDLVTLFRRGGVDVAAQVEPAATLMREQGLAVVYKTGEQISPDQQGGLMVASEQFLKDNPCAAVAFARGLQKAAEDLRAGNGQWTPELSNIAVKYWKVPADLLPKLGATPYASPDGRVDTTGLSQAQDVYAKQGLVTVPIDVNELVDGSIVDAIGTGGGQK
ncbi:hypothetical protein DI005_20970 [Prauserella sp. PE36]|uniref:ABC transporter substrate-binding protein n=1 Tax=Prauserella sp. PE36 TaxID=1504709 RepID=UPI000DE27F64|nr:ABC transporter substrate-binding protein [Prauserella sp. PE36]RBM17710.1 hypothetical protein DI005_20970 [Prauserella sp. PE36]